MDDQHVLALVEAIHGADFYTMTYNAQTLGQLRAGTPRIAGGRSLPRGVRPAAQAPARRGRSGAENAFERLLFDPSRYCNPGPAISKQRHVAAGALIGSGVRRWRAPLMGREEHRRGPPPMSTTQKKFCGGRLPPC
jgi:hypothetical protein